MKNKIIFLAIFFTQYIFANYFEDIELLKPSARVSAISSSLTFEDPNSAVVSNPSILSLADKTSISLFYSSLFQNLITNSSVNLVYKIPTKSKIYSKTKLNSFGINILYNQINTENTLGLSFYDQNNNGIKDPNEEILYETEKILQDNNSNLLINFATSRELNKNLFLGGTLKFLNVKFSNETANAFSLDIGFLYRMPKIQNLLLGIKIKNLLNSKLNWSNNNKEEIPLRAEIGVGYKTSLQPNLGLFLSTEYGTSNEGYYSLGTELSYKTNYFLRLGYSKIYLNSKYPTEFSSVGLGAIFKKNISMDYTIKFSNFQENIQFISLSYSF